MSTGRRRAPRRCRHRWRCQAGLRRSQFYSTSHCSMQLRRSHRRSGNLVCRSLSCSFLFLSPTLLGSPLDRHRFNGDRLCRFLVTHLLKQDERLPGRSDGAAFVGELPVRRSRTPVFDQRPHGTHCEFDLVLLVDRRLPLSLLLRSPTPAFVLSEFFGDLGLTGSENRRLKKREPPKDASRRRRGTRPTRIPRALGGCIAPGGPHEAPQIRRDLRRRLRAVSPSSRVFSS